MAHEHFEWRITEKAFLLTRYGVKADALSR
jgi:hypothetical protein